MSKKTLEKVKAAQTDLGNVIRTYLDAADEFGQQKDWKTATRFTNEATYLQGSYNRVAPKLGLEVLNIVPAVKTLVGAGTEE